MFVVLNEQSRFQAWFSIPVFISEQRKYNSEWKMHGTCKLDSNNIQVSISSTFYAQLSCTKLFCAAFLQLQFGLAIFWHKNIGAKAVHEMLMKLTSEHIFKQHYLIRHHLYHFGITRQKRERNWLDYLCGVWH